MLEPFCSAIFFRKNKIKTCSFLVGWELIIVLAFFAVAWWFSGDTVVALIGSPWEWQ